MNQCLTVFRWSVLFLLFYTPVIVADQIIILRHALAPGIGDPVNFDLADCETQRVLSDEGRQQAIQLGVKLRALGINKADVFSSEWCRCWETATLLDLGAPQKLTALNSFFHPSNRHLKNQFLKDWRSHIIQYQTDNPRIYITHQVNISGLFNEFISSGEGVIVKVSENEELKIISFLQ